MCKKVNKYTNLKNCEKYVEAFQNSKVPNGGVKQHIEQLNYQCIVLVNALVAITVIFCKVNNPQQSIIVCQYK